MTRGHAIVGAGAVALLAGVVGALLVGDDGGPARAAAVGGGPKAVAEREQVALTPARPEAQEATSAPPGPATAVDGPPEATRTPFEFDRDGAEVVVRGRVVDRGGRALLGASVVVWDTIPVQWEVLPGPQEAGPERRADLFLAHRRGLTRVDRGVETTGVDGVFEARVTDRGERDSRWVSVRHDDRGDVSIGGRGPLAPGDVDLGDVIVYPVPALRLRVTSGGRPLQAQAHLFEEVTAPGEQTPHTSPLVSQRATDADGRVVHHPTGRRVFWSVHAEGHASAHGHADMGPEGATVEVALAPAVTVRGRVVDEAGRPLDGAWVEAHEGGGEPHSGPSGDAPALLWARRSSSAAADADGRFTLDRLASGREYAVYGRADGKAHAIAWVTAPATDVVLTLPDDRGLRVVVHPAGEVQGAFAFVLQALDEDGGWRDEHLQPTTDASMDYARLAPGVYRVAVHATGYAPVVSGPVTVGPGAPPPGEVALVLDRPARTVSGRVVDAAGAPLTGVPVVWRDFGGLAVQTGPDGAFALEGLPHGALTLVVGPGEQRVEVAAGRAAVGDVRLEAR
ncbi:MAG: carboxypeptidase regulatory-like domain-containing protein [Planctomycetes bacterium]|nr:carboxypeptidase regulatory-like domain-containing protein [Planctomycetota bacterium]